MSSGAWALFPLAFNQEKRLLLEEVRHRSGRVTPPFNALFGFRISGSLDVALLDSALNGVIERHAGLRAAFFPAPDITAEERSARLKVYGRTGWFTPGLFIQRIQPGAVLRLKNEILTQLTEDQRGQRVKVLCAAELETPFNLEQPPLVRARLLELQNQEHLLIITISHLLVDLWSLAIFERELKILYQSAEERCAPSLPELRFHSPDFAVYQRSWFATQSFLKSAAWWRARWPFFERSQLSHAELPFGKPPESPRGGQRGTCMQVLAQELTAQLRAFSRAARVTPWMVMFAALLALLRHYTGRPSISIWTNLANRSVPGAPNAIGWFVNTHLVAVDLDEDVTVTELLVRTRTCILDAIAHQGVPRTLLWSAEEPRPHISETLLVFDNDPALELFEPTKIGSAGVTFQRTLLPSAPAWISGFLITVGGGRQGTTLLVNYSADLFEASSVARMLIDFQALLARLISHPEMHLSGLAPV